MTNSDNMKTKDKIIVPNKANLALQSYYCSILNVLMTQKHSENTKTFCKMLK